MSIPMATEALTIENLTVRYPMRGGVLGRVQQFFTAVEDFSFSLETGEILAIVGESGCGKSTLAQALVGLAPWTIGKMTLLGEELKPSSRKDLTLIRRQMQMVFQDPFSSLNPRQTVSEILMYPLLARGFSRIESSQKIKETLSLVGLSTEVLSRFPHAFSGGQRQRIGIARSLVLSPKILICDEVTSALDVSVQAQVIQVLDEIRRQAGISLIFISHDMQVVRALADNVIVMYLGQIMEKGSVSQVLNSPKHPYTKALIKSIPTLDREHPPEILEGDWATHASPKTGCRFAPRCPQRMPHCTEDSIPLDSMDSVLCRCVLGRPS
ncbi:MAG TPA: ABC transporter ATP-binding protein [Fibrobacteraceae bacterium]|nr:ABC transporter ATP-binding protein [Fibrobacteraceae bacterium]HQB64452.1 ABC transporter ATP-binding protein [Fibrobacteraceae bacterium]